VDIALRGTMAHIMVRCQVGRMIIGKQ